MSQADKVRSLFDDPTIHAWLELAQQMFLLFERYAERHGRISKGAFQKRFARVSMLLVPLNRRRCSIQKYFETILKHAAHAQSLDAEVFASLVFGDPSTTALAHRWLINPYAVIYAARIAGRNLTEDQQVSLRTLLAEIEAKLGEEPSVTKTIFPLDLFFQQYGRTNQFRELLRHGSGPALDRLETYEQLDRLACHRG